MKHAEQETGARRCPSTVLGDLLPTVQSTVLDVSKRHAGSVAPRISAMSIMISLLVVLLCGIFFLFSVLSSPHCAAALRQSQHFQPR
jgi:hypothetical protein